MTTHTILRRDEQHRDRWSWFHAESGLVRAGERPTLRELKAIDLFREFDDQFLETISPDVSIATWAKDAVLFEEGSYIDLAFYVLRGEVAVYLASLQDEPAGQAPIFDVRQRGERAETRGSPPSAASVHYQRSEQLEASETRALLSVMDFDLPTAGSVVRLGRGEFFGEIGALNGWPQSATARTITECDLVQIRLPALRLMKRRSRALKARLDALYRERSLLPHLRSCPLFSDCSESLVAEIAACAELVSCEPGEVVVEQGSAMQAIHLVRSGFMKLAEQLGPARMAVAYLSKGMTFGEIEFLVEGAATARCTMSSVGYGELVRIPAAELERIVARAPDLERELWERAAARMKETGRRRADTQASEFLEFALAQGLVEGNSVLVIDLNHCTRCDDCVRACASTHGGRPRFVREGDRLGHLLIAKSCYHCEDPVCLVGCPTGAIRRANVGDVVEIRESICIGCGTCARNCPYDAIVMHETGTDWPADALPKSLRGTPRLVASKCDLCYTSPAGPACVRNCPQGCAFRTGSLDELQRLGGEGHGS